MAATGREQSAGTVETTNGRTGPRIDLNPAFRAGILAATGNPLVSRLVQRHGMRLGAARFVAGATFDEAVPVLRPPNPQGLRTNTTLLCEGVPDESQARNADAAYQELRDRLRPETLLTHAAS